MRCYNEWSTFHNITILGIRFNHFVLVGDIVGVFCNGKSVAEKSLSGIVTVIKTSLVSVAFDDLPDTVDLRDFDGSLQLVKLYNDVTYQRIRRCIFVVCYCP